VTLAPDFGRIFNLLRGREFRYDVTTFPVHNPVKSRKTMHGHPTSGAPLRAYVVIPARYGSTRLPKKMLLRQTGKTLLQHTYEAAIAARRPAGVLVATDHAEIAREVECFHGEFVLTSPDYASGTDRVAEVARKLPRADIIVNVQGDEPEMSPDNIDRVIELLEQNPSARMATLATPLPSPELLHNPACVKVVFDAAGRAMYFSRAAIPFVRDTPPSAPCGLAPFNDPPLFYQHLGIYAYRREALLEFAALPPSSIENAEKLEQLRVLQAGHAIYVGVVQHASSGIDTPADYAAFVARRKAG
jgi:3-deoxy-manno-octulosonate cytidylyltransferase (CMP-KDO synthetase)